VFGIVSDKPGREALVAHPSIFVGAGAGVWLMPGAADGE
jgi:hypothetical protein